MTDLKTTKKIILFDGVCNLCNSSVLKVIKFDKKNNFVFASLQSETGLKIIQKLNINTSLTDSIILYESDVSYYTKSSAVLKIMNELGGFWRLSQFFWIFPTRFRDAIYDYIAKNRYKWFGKKEQCMIPTPELTAKFLD
ncbi:putative DCC family thiol-disulfide oxidoreductase YuxK [Tenacibaculum adriaticum]|uniref:Putative DCC family thiol-disulfide oxidoreductase YuxK n=1 Tax=Tenacibaculum adriaticum TaxID=413713 RepID=A0A5S5DSR8_9FLAO|nr:thiol-disulfide oxidoreductase DCC family protein [Tenacibaculum adriaticum]TYP98734.1 putative DCC family thiol-disulfide oxidoreductase YuxK [Tenacibaculum adriaticum]